MVSLKKIGSTEFYDKFLIIKWKIQYSGIPHRLFRTVIGITSHRYSSLVDRYTKNKAVKFRLIMAVSKY